LDTGRAILLAASPCVGVASAATVGALFAGAGDAFGRLDGRGRRFTAR
jgi:hypothetical protein